MTPEQFDAILEGIRGGQPAHKAIKGVKIKPPTFYLAISKDELLADRYVRAKIEGCHAVADEIERLADTQMRGKVTTKGKDGITIKIGDNVERTRLQIDARKWLLAKLIPKRYGDRLELNSDGGPLVVIRNLTGKGDPGGKENPDG
jgi:hypothetical protein